MKLLLNAPESIEPGLIAIDVWTNEWRRTETVGARDPACPCCGERRFEFLDGDRMPSVTVLCGQNSVQIAPRRAATSDLAALALRFAPHGAVERAPGFVHVKLEADAVNLVVFADGRIVVRGTSEPERARSIAARYVGT